MTTTTEVITGGCSVCGVSVTRQRAEDGPLAAMLNGLPLWCDLCVAADDEVEAERRKREAEEEVHGLYIFREKDSGIPPKFLSMRVRDLDHPAELKRLALDWTTDGGGLLLMGDIGRGKTTIAGAAAAQRLWKSSVRWTSAPVLFARLGSGFGSESREWALELLAGKSALVLDDIDKARPTEYAAEQVFAAIDQRVAYEQPLLVTSNLAPSALAEHWPEPYGPAIASRLVGYCKVARVDGVDRRLGGGS